MDADLVVEEDFVDDRDRLRLSGGGVGGIFTNPGR